MASIIKKSRVIFLVFSFLLFAHGAAASDQTNTSKIAITVTERSGKDLKDYQILIDFNESNFSFDADKDRLSFTDENDARLNYWVENWDSSAKEAKVWVKIPELKADESKTVYMDLGGSDSSDGFKTFDLFDDFDDKDYTNNNFWTNKIDWDDYGVCGYLDASGGSLRIYQTCNGGNSAEAPLRTINGVWEMKFLLGSRGGCDYTRLIWYFIKNEKENYYAQVGGDAPYTENRIIFGNDNGRLTYTDTPIQGAWHKLKIIHYENEFKIYLDDKEQISYTGKSKFSINASQTVLSGHRNCGYADVSVDDIRVRQYTSPEPEVRLGEDIFIKESSLAISKQGGNKYLINGKIFSAFNKDIKNIDIAAYSADPANNSALELSRISIDEIRAREDTDFEITVSVDSNDKISEFYVFADPDNKIAEGNKTNNIAKRKIPENILETISPLLISIIIFIFIFLILSILYYSHKISQKNREAQKQIFQTKACLKCGMVLDRNQSKCPVCGMRMFKQ